MAEKPRHHLGSSNRGRLVAHALAAGLAVGACSGGDGDPQASDAPDCETRDLSAAAGAPPQSTDPPRESEEVARFIAEAFCSTVTAQGPGDVTVYVGRAAVSSGEAECIGERLVEDLGVDRASQRFQQPAWDLLGFGLTNNSSSAPIERDEAEQIVAIFEECSESWEMLLVRSVTEGASEMSDESARCAGEQLDDDVGRTILVGEIDRAYDDPTQPDATPFADVVQPLLAVFEQCLSPEELDRLDWG